MPYHNQTQRCHYVSAKRISYSVYIYQRCVCICSGANRLQVISRHDVDTLSIIQILYYSWYCICKSLLLRICDYYSRYGCRADPVLIRFKCIIVVSVYALVSNDARSLTDGMLIVYLLRHPSNILVKYI